MAALLFRSTFLGADYSERLFTTVGVNTAITFCLFVCAAALKSQVRLLLSITAFAISLAWFLVWAINTAV